MTATWLVSAVVGGAIGAVVGLGILCILTVLAGWIGRLSDGE